MAATHDGASRVASAREPMLLSGAARGNGRDAAATGADVASAPAQTADEAVRPVSTFALFRDATASERFVLLVATVASVCTGFMNPALGFFMQDLIDAIFAPNPEERDRRVRDVALVFCAFGACTFVLTTTSQVGFARVADNIAARMRRRFFAHLLEKDVGWYDQHSTAEMATRLTQDTFDFRLGCGDKFSLLLSSLIQVPTAFVCAFFRSWRLTLMLLGVLPVIAFVFGLTFRLMGKSLQDQQKFYAKAGGVAETTIGAIRTVAAFGGYQREIGKYDETLALAERDGTRSGIFSGLAGGTTAMVMYLTFALGFWLGSMLVIRDYRRQCWESAPPYGDCFTGATMMSTLFCIIGTAGGLSQIGLQMGVVSSARSAAARIYNLIEQPPAFDADVGEKLQKVEGAIDFKGVVFSYPTRPDVLALSMVSFNVRAGSTAAFVGPSGSGKSTSIALLQRFYDPMSGTVCLDGRDIRSLNLIWLREQMALVQQEPVLFSGSILQNIAYGRDGALDQDVKKAAKAANADNFIRSFPNGYKTEVGERGVQLSGGQKQRIAIARAMVREPKVLLLDEATSALDTESERVVKLALDSILAERARTTLMIAHRLSTVRDADVIYVMEMGKLREHGSHSELMALKDGLYAHLVELQELEGVEEAPALARQLSRQVSAGSEGRPAGFALGDAAVTGQQHRKEHKSGRHVVPMTGGLDELPFGRVLTGSSVSLDDEDGAAVAAAAPVPASGVPEEDEAEQPVPTSRLWSMQKKNAGWIAISFAAVFPLGALAPFMGQLFGDSTTSLSMPPVDMFGNVIYSETTINNDVHRNCLMFLSLSVVAFVMNFTSVYGFRRTSEGLTRTIRLRTFEAMLRQEMGFFDARSTGMLTDRLATEAPLIKAFSGESLAGLMQLLVTISVTLIITLSNSWILTCSAAAFVPLMLAGNKCAMRNLQRKNETTAGPLVTEVMGNIRTVVSYGLQERMVQRYVELLQQENGEEKRLSLMVGLSAGYNAFVMFLLYGLVILVADFWITRGVLQPREVFKVLFPLIFSAGSLTRAATQWLGDKKKGAHALKHIFNTIDRVPQIDAYDDGGLRLDVVIGEVAFKHVSFRYPSRPDITIFSDFDLTIEPGKTVAFVGPSGSGKSTTVALLQRFYDPAAGAVTLDGHDLKILNLKWLREQMSLVQQEPILFGGSIAENIAYGRVGASEGAVREAAKAANAHRFIEEFPEGYDTDVGERGSQLSGGQKQRIAIARAMIRDPKVLLLDEATSALDTESERVVQEALDVLLAAKRRTTLVIAHRLSTITGSDQICVIYEGKVVEKGTHAELMRLRDGHYKKLAARQQKET